MCEVALNRIGFLLVYARGRIQRWSHHSQQDGTWIRYMPKVSPVMVTPLGLFIALRSVVETGIITNLQF